MSLVVFDPASNGTPKAAAAAAPVERQLVDAMPYTDSYDPDAQVEVLALIEAEMRSFRPPNYLKDRPPIQVNFSVCIALITCLIKINN